MLDAFTTPQKGKSLGTNDSQTPFAIFVKKLQESLTRMESFDVVTVTQGMDGTLLGTKVQHLAKLTCSSDSKRSSSPSLLARQLRLRLVAAEDGDIPRNLSNIVVSIHAIATFQALHDYLRPRVSGTLVGGSRLSGMLAALAAGAGRTSTSALASGSSASAPLPMPRVPLPEASTSSAGPSSASAPPAQIERRRSQRLRAKDGPSSSSSSENVVDAPARPADEPAASTSEPGVDSEVAPSAGGETAPSDTIVNDEPDYGDFTDEEVDAEVRLVIARYGNSIDRDSGIR
jgi:E3 ubiquitin-protein ligase TRIP12